MYKATTLSLFSIFFSIPALAQVSADGSLSTTVTTTDGKSFTINNGNKQEGNLYHSFREFSVPTGGEAFFNNPASVANIFSRVTGGSISEINGLIRTANSANLFLLNPAGILFGPNASLNIGGSFIGSTADSILFPNDIEFSATDTQPTPTLTINAPIGLNFRDNPGEIVNQSVVDEAGLQVSAGESLALVGGKVINEGGAITALDGKIFLGGLATAGTVSLDEAFNFNLPENTTRSDVLINDGASLNVRAEGRGTVDLIGNNIEISEGLIRAGVDIGLGDSEIEPGGINIDAADTVAINNLSLVSNATLGPGNGGDITINAENNLDIDVSDIGTGAFVVEPGVLGAAGNINITTRELKIDNESRISTSTQGEGNAGDVNIQAKSFSLNNASVIFNDTLGTGNAGNTNVKVDSLSLVNGGELTSSTEGEGNAGNINVDATDSVTLIGTAPVQVIFGSDTGGFSSGFFSTSAVGATGRGGQITVNTDRLKISEGATLNARTKSAASAGNILVNAKTLEITGGGQILTAAFAGGDAGNITLNISETINISGSDPTFESRREQVIELFNQLELEEPDPEQTIDPVSPESGIFASTGSDSTGSAGNIFIRGASAGDNIDLQLPALNLANDGRIAVDSRGQGDGGNVSIQGSSLSLENNAAILAGTPQGTGGNINLDLQNNLTLREQSLISAEATNNADGGNIDIDADFVVAFPNNSDVLASAEGGDGGNININTQGLFGIQERPQNPLTNDIDASSEFGLAGTVSITTPDVEVFQGLTELPTNVTDADTVSANVCSVDSSTTASNLLVKGKGGVPPQPIEPLNADSLLIGGESQANIPAPGANSSKVPQIQPIKTALGDITLARGVKVTKDGRVILTSYATSGDRLPNNSVNCS